VGEIGKTKVSLRLFSDDLDPESVTSLLGRQPTRSWRAGDMKFGRPAKFGSWHLNSDPLAPGDLDTQIGSLLGSLPTDMAVWNDLTKQHRADLFCGLFLTESNQGLVLSPDTMAAVAIRGLKLSLDIYGSPDADEAAGESSI
jgi:Domain of unknown function (DUF4279)